MWSARDAVTAVTCVPDEKDNGRLVYATCVLSNVSLFWDFAGLRRVSPDQLTGVRLKRHAQVGVRSLTCATVFCAAPGRRAAHGARRTAHGARQAHACVRTRTAAIRPVWGGAVCACIHARITSRHICQVYQWLEDYSTRARTDFVHGGIVYQDEYTYSRGWAYQYHDGSSFVKPTTCALTQVCLIAFCCHMIGLFCHMIGLFCHMIGLFCDIIGLFCHMIELFCHVIGLFCDMIGLFCHMIGLFCHVIGLFCDMKASFAI